MRVRNKNLSWEMIRKCKDFLLFQSLPPFLHHSRKITNQKDLPSHARPPFSKTIQTKWGKMRKAHVRNLQNFKMLYNLVHRCIVWCRLCNFFCKIRSSNRYHKNFLIIEMFKMEISNLENLPENQSKSVGIISSECPLHLNLFAQNLSFWIFQTLHKSWRHFRE